MDEAWEALAAVERARIADLFAAEPDRLGRLALDACGMHFDFSKRTSAPRTSPASPSLPSAGPCRPREAPVHRRPRQRHRTARRRA
jgi:hypothetical protein